MISKYGADLVRLWVASSDYRVDVRVSDNIFKQLSEAYRKIRNTARIIMANLGDFNPDTDMVAIADMYEIDKWIIAACNELTKTSRKAYDDFEFHVIYHDVCNFCTTNLSKLYIDITKDRVYVGKKDGFARRSAQSAMYLVLNALTRLIAPLLAFTSEEIWQAMPHAASDVRESVFLNQMPSYDEALTFPEITERWNKQFALRDDVMKALELARAEKLIGKSLDAKITIYTENEETYKLLESFGEELPTVYIVSGASIVLGKTPDGVFSETESGIGVKVEGADGEKCARCWSYSTKGEHDEEGGFLCDKCKAIIEA
jgi:isoleucyl-tRNA synthetase